MRKILLSSLLATSFLSLSLALADAQWGYTGETTPEKWGELDPKFATCSSGFNQSPINIQKAKESALEKLQFDYKKGDADIINNGHTIQVTSKTDSALIFDDGTYKLLQFHFHSPSENLIDGKSYPLEAHFVHQNDQGQLAVFGVLYSEGEENAELNKLWQAMPQEQKNSIKDIDPRQLIPDTFKYYRFSGSLTTPPCTEGVIWLVADQYPTVSKAQIDLFNSTMKHQTNRPVQPTFGRVINH